VENRPIDRALAWAKARGWNQSELARQVGATPQDITNWKTRGMPPEWHAPVAAVLARSIEELIGRAGPAQKSVPTRDPAPGTLPHPGASAPLSYELTAALRRLPPEELRRVENLVRLHLGMETLPRAQPLAGEKRYRTGTRKA